MELSLPSSLATTVSDSTRSPPNNSEASTKYFHFLHLPTEIRLKVYEEAFTQCNDERSTRKVYVSKSWANSVEANLVTPAGLNLTKVNKRMHDESLAVLYRIHVFRLSAWGEYRNFMDRSLFSTTKQLLSQLTRPSASSSLSMMTQIYLFLDECWETAHKKSRDSIVRRIATSCTNLKTFCLQMQHIPEDWVFLDNDLMPRNPAFTKGKRKTLESLRGLASRVRDFEVLNYVRGYNELRYENFWAGIVSGQSYVRTEEDYGIRWTSNIATARRSLVFHLL